MAEAAKHSDHPRIWLQNDADADRHEGRLWCEDKVWPDDAEDGAPTEYVRADLFEAQSAALRIASDELSRLLFNEPSETTHKAIDAVDAVLKADAPPMSKED